MRKAEVDQDGLACFPDDDVGGLPIKVDEVLSVEAVLSLRHLAAEEGDHGGGQRQVRERGKQAFARRRLWAHGAR
jgi:hypothetical protein